MYTMIERRKANTETMQATVQRAQTEFFPHIQSAPGFNSFYLIGDEAQGTNTAIVVWESKAQCDAFDATVVGQGWRQALEELGHTLQSDNRGETIFQLEPKK